MSQGRSVLTVHATQPSPRHQSGNSDRSVLTTVARTPRVPQRYPISWCENPGKASLYARAGIADYWIVDLVHAALEVHRDPEASPDASGGWRYRSVVTLRPPATVAPLASPGTPIPVADLLP